MRDFTELNCDITKGLANSFWLVAVVAVSSLLLISESFKTLRELSYLIYLVQGWKNFWRVPNLLTAYYGAIKCFGKSAKHLMGCESFGIYFMLK